MKFTSVFNGYYLQSSVFNLIIKAFKVKMILNSVRSSLCYYCTDMFLALDKDKNGTLSKQELKEYADGTLTEIFIERGIDLTFD